MPSLDVTAINRLGTLFTIWKQTIFWKGFDGETNNFAAVRYFGASIEEHIKLNDGDHHIFEIPLNFFKVDEGRLPKYFWVHDIMGKPHRSKILSKRKISNEIYKLQKIEAESK